ncbi:SPASM domain-containing protein [Psychromonas sp. SP041]|uniref:radical SAM/SPASM domain-containing protein n=1 Tax=Psychromonas sp. SP041 TaxID=1365007 RepID=UPI0010C7D6A1|nr:SPASM domain-containing protein [Psychromonas sp. SP041]
MSGKTFLFQINVTRDCNLRCTHCYISTDKKVQSQYMNEEQFIEAFSQVVDFMKKDFSGKKSYSLAEIHVIGGEPTMLGYEFFEKNLPLVREKLSEIPQDYRLSIVTNLITNQAVKIASLFDMVATSYEEKTRFVSKTGEAKPKLAEKWESNVKKMNQSGHSPTVTMAVTKQAIERGAASLLDYFNKEVGFEKMHLGFFIPSGDGLVNISDVFPMFHETSQFMIEATDWYLERRLENKDMYVNPVESMIESIYGNEAIDDIVCPIIPGSIDIDWDGETVTCIEAGGEVDMTSLGNIFETPITEIISSKAYKRERANAIITKPACRGCDELMSCQSACGVLHQYWNGRGECPGFKSFIKYIRFQVEVNGIKPKSVIYREERQKSAGC